MMKKLTLLFLSTLLALSLGAQDLIVNGDFETGDKTGWKGYNNGVVAAEGVDGSFAGRINNNADGSLLQTPVTVTPGNTYNVSFFAKWPDGTGNAEGISVVLQTTGKEKIAQTATLNSVDWSYDSTQITIPPGVTEIRFVMWKPKSPLLYIDNVSMTDAGAIRPALAVSSDGEILEGAEDGEVITVEMLNDVFAATLDPANWTIEGLPEGVSVGSVERVSDTQATLTLSGNAADYDKTLNLSLTVAGSEFETYNEVVLAGYEITFTATVEPPPALTLVTDADIREDFEDGTVIGVAMKDDTFADPLTPANWTGLNLPEGVTVGTLERVNDTMVNVTLSGNTTGDYDLDITGAGFTIAADEFSTWNDPVEVTGLTFLAAIEGGEELLWEENFDAYTDGTDLTDTIGGNDYGFRWDLIDSAMVYGGVAALHPTHAQAWNSDSVDHRFQYVYSPIEMGKTYVFYMDSRTDDGAKTTVSVLVGEGGQFKVGPDGSTEMRTRSVIVEPFLPEQDTAGCGIYNWGWNVADRVIYIDNMKLFVLTDPRISLASDGEIMEGAEDGEVLTITLQNDVFSSTLDVANWTIDNLPEGVTVSGISRIDDTHAEITLAGNSSQDYDVDITGISISGSREEFVNSNKNLSADGDVVFTAIIEPAAITITDDGEILEGAEDGEVITVTLSLDTFTESLTPSNWTVTNLPEGVSVGEIFRVDSVTVEIVLSGNATEDYDSDITNLMVMVAATELTEWESDISVESGVTFIASDETSVSQFSAAGISAYPNPVNDHLTVDAENTIAAIEVYTLLGQKESSYTNLNTRSVSLDTGNWKSGIYILHVTDVQGNTRQLKVIK